MLGPVSASCTQPVGVPTLKADIVTLCISEIEHIKYLLEMRVE